MSFLFYFYKFTQIFRYISTLPLLIIIGNIIYQCFTGKLGIFINELYDFSSTLLFCLIIIIFFIFIIFIPKLLLNKLTLLFGIDKYYSFLSFAILGNFIISISFGVFSLYSHYVLSNKFINDTILNNSWISLKKIGYKLTEIFKFSEHTMKYPTINDSLKNQIEYFTQLLLNENNILSNKMANIENFFSGVNSNDFFKILPSMWDNKIHYLIGGILVIYGIWYIYNISTNMGKLQELIYEIINYNKLLNSNERTFIEIFNKLIDISTKNNLYLLQNEVHNLKIIEQLLKLRDSGELCSELYVKCSSLITYLSSL